MWEGGLDDADRLRFERLLQWLRLTFLLSPFLALAAFGAAALPYAFAIAGAVALSYGGVEMLLRRTPPTLLQHQLGLHFVDIVLTGAVLTAYHSFLGDAYFDSVYLLFVVAGAGTQGRGGAVLLAAASGAGVFVTRLLLILNGAMPYETRHLTDSDRGIGIPEAEQSRVFEPFFRAANVTDCVPGTGVGLAATRQIVEALGGAITLRSTSGEGTTFTVHLPLEQPG